jgi:cobaltochelatase CobN
LAPVDAPVFQLVLSASLAADWAASGAGLTARDLAMNVALPELDGRILTRAVGFKQAPKRHPLTHAMTTAYDAVPDRIDFAVQLAAGVGTVAANCTGRQACCSDYGELSEP